MIFICFAYVFFSEYAKMLTVCQSYALVSTGVRCSVSNTLGKSGRSVVLQTTGGKDVKELITNVFGTATHTTQSLFAACTVLPLLVFAGLVLTLTDATVYARAL